MTHHFLERSLFVLFLVGLWVVGWYIKRESQSLLITTQNNAIRTNLVKAKKDNTWQNSKCLLCGKRHKTDDLIRSEWSELAQSEYKTQLDGERNPPGIVQEMEIWSKEQMVHVQTLIRPGEWEAINSQPFLDTNTSPIPVKWPYLLIINKNNVLVV